MSSYFTWWIPINRTFCHSAPSKSCVTHVTKTCDIVTHKAYYSFFLNDNYHILTWQQAINSIRKSIFCIITVWIMKFILTVFVQYWNARHWQVDGHSKRLCWDHSHSKIAKCVKLLYMTAGYSDQITGYEITIHPIPV